MSFGRDDLAWLSNTAKAGAAKVFGKARFLGGNALRRLKRAPPEPAPPDVTWPPEPFVVRMDSCDFWDCRPPAPLLGRRREATLMRLSSR